MNVRVAAAHILAGVIRDGGSLNSLLPGYQDKIPAKDRGLLQELCFGTLRHYFPLQALLELLIAKPIKAKEAEVTALILSGLYQIREMRTPSHAAVNETVAAISALNKPWAKGLANGVLRRYLREREALDLRAAQNSRYRTGHPGWLQSIIEQSWPEQSEQILAANNQRPPMCLRVNAQRSNREAYLVCLQEAGIAARPAPLAAQGIYLQEPCAVELLPGFNEGLVSVQDEAAQLCASFLDLAPGQRVLDACCAPGGKTCHILETEPGIDELTALDVDGSRLARVRENLERLGFYANVMAADAADPESWWHGEAFDRILLDAPCSATGVIRRHPDIKLLRQQQDIPRLADIQYSLLNALWTTLKPGGKLLYATCSVLPAENTAVLARFVASQPDCSCLPLALPGGLQTPFGCQLFPQDQGHDGFYYGLLVKNSGNQL